MDDLELKEACNPKNPYSGSPFTPSSFLNQDKVRQRAKASSQRVFSEWTTLRRIMERGPEMLEKQWMKNTRKKQKEVLLQA
jgi:hypothetical protein